MRNRRFVKMVHFAPRFLVPMTSFVIRRATSVTLQSRSIENDMEKKKYFKVTDDEISTGWARVSCKHKYNYTGGFSRSRSDIKN